LMGTVFACFKYLSRRFVNMTLTVTLSAPAAAPAAQASGQGAASQGAAANSASSAKNPTAGAKDGNNDAQSANNTNGASNANGASGGAAQAASAGDAGSANGVANPFARLLGARMASLNEAALSSGANASASASASASAADAASSGQLATPGSTAASGVGKTQANGKANKSSSQNASNQNNSLLPSVMLFAAPQTVPDPVAPQQGPADAGAGLGGVSGVGGAQAVAAQGASAGPAASASDALLAQDALNADGATVTAKHAAVQNLPLDAAAQATILPQATTSTNNVAAGSGAAATPSFSIDQTMGTSAWSKAISDQVMTMVSMKAETAQIQISPPQLGPIQVSLKMDGQNNAQVTFTADSAATRAALEGSLPRLHDMMASSGIQLSGAQVSSGQSQGQQQQQQQASRMARTVFNPDVPDSEESDTLASIKAARSVLSIFA
jgi:flagellar hook-length control protein FliK